MPSIEKDDSRGEPQAVATSIDASEEQSNPETTEHAGEVKRQQMDHIAEQGHVESVHDRLVIKPITVQEAMKTPETKAAVDEEWIKKLRQCQVRPKSEVVHQTKEDGKLFMFASLMDSSHL